MQEDIKDDDVIAVCPCYILNKMQKNLITCAGMYKRRCGGGGGVDLIRIRDPIGYRSLILGNVGNENDDVRQKWPAEVDIFSLSVL